MENLLSMSALACALAVICEGVGVFTARLLKIKTHGYAALQGAAVIFVILEMFCLPFIVLDLSIIYMAVLCAAAAIAGIAVTMINIKDVMHNILQKDTLWIVVTILWYLFVLHNVENISFSSQIVTMESNAWSQSVQLCEGGMHGYELLGAVFLRFLTVEQFAAAFGVLYHIIFSVMCLNMIRTFHLKNPWFTFTLISYTLLFNGFNQWQILNAYDGDNWRIIFIAAILWCIYIWIKEGNEQDKYMLPIYIGAGMFVSGGFGMVSMMILYCLCTWLFKERKLKSLYDFTTFLIPQILYGGFQIGREYPLAGALILILYAVFLIMRNQPALRRMMARAEDFLFDHSYIYMIAVIPVLFMIVTAVMMLFFNDLVIPYSYYKNFLEVEPARSYLFLDHKLMIILIDICRWGGMAVLMFMAKKKEDKQLRIMYILMLVLFVNPLSMGLMAKITGTEVYAYAFEILFNPFTDLLLLIMIYKMFEWQVFGQWILEILLVASVLMGNGGSFLNMPSGLYEDLVKTIEITEVTE